MLVAVVAHAEPAAEVEHGRAPAELAGRPLAEGGEPVDGEQALVDPLELRADVEVDAGDVEAELAGRARSRSSASSGAEPELRLVVRGLDRLVRDGLDARRQPHEHAPHAGGGRARSGSSGASSTTSRARLGGRPQLLVRLVVAVEEEPVARRARPPARSASSPSVETSAPIPSSASTRRSATFANAFVP